MKNANDLSSTSAPAGTIPKSASIDALIQPSDFAQHAISEELYQLILDKSYKRDSALPITSLAYLKVLHYGFDQATHSGELIVHETIAAKVLLIFKELYLSHYPIEKLRLVDYYGADDSASMADNNSSAFNYRMIDGTDILSNHSLGLAIDINPLYNPYIKTVKGRLRILPQQGSAFVDRTGTNPYMICKEDICYRTFIKYGFTWGGDWLTCKDYQHFEIAFQEQRVCTADTSADALSL